MIALIFSLLILLIVVMGIIASMSLKKKKSKTDPSPSPSTMMTKVSSIEPQDTSQNFSTENTRRAIENLVRQLNENSSINPYVNSSSMDF